MGMSHALIIECSEQYVMEDRCSCKEQQGFEQTPTLPWRSSVSVQVATPSVDVSWNTAS